ncbi:MAG: hypothetical protein K2X53_05310 [Alphaproteobacteria bacterium]|nr:hypothetical protein [Alphaproteobacteria bacterium]
MRKISLGLATAVILFGGFQNAHALGVLVQNNPPALVGNYNIEVEIRGGETGNDPLFVKKFDIKDMGAKGQKHFATSVADDSKIPDEILASNLIVKLMKDNKVVSEARNTTGKVDKNQFQGISITFEKSPTMAPKIIYVLTSDEAGVLPVPNLPRGTDNR